MPQVLLLSKLPLFKQSVETLLRSKTEIEIIGQDTEVDQAIDHLLKHQPDAIILDSTDAVCISPETVTRFLKGCATAKVMGLNLGNNTLTIYSKDKRVIKDAEYLRKTFNNDDNISTENKVKKLLGQILSEPSYRLVLYKILKFCETPRLTSEIVNEIRLFPEMVTAIHSPNTLLRWLEEADGIERVVMEKEVEYWQLTETGKQVIEIQAPETRLRELIAQEPVYGDIYHQVLRFCEIPKTRSEVENILQGNPILEKPRIFASFFIENLESVGGLEWNGKWYTTEAGKGVTR